MDLFAGSSETMETDLSKWQTELDSGFDVAGGSGREGREGTYLDLLALPGPQQPRPPELKCQLGAGSCEKIRLGGRCSSSFFSWPCEGRLQKS